MIQVTFKASTEMRPSSRGGCHSSPRHVCIQPDGVVGWITGHHKVVLLAAIVAQISPVYSKQARTRTPLDCAATVKRKLARLLVLVQSVIFGRNISES